MLQVLSCTCNVIGQQTYDDAVHELGVDVRDFEAMLSSDDEDEPLVGRTKPRNEHQELEPVANDKGKGKTATEKKSVVEPRRRSKWRGWQRQKKYQHQTNAPRKPLLNKTEC
ncbi:hypothetical protein BJV82DRAFT_653283, partial [Fennellomyces sp. T-0311]